MVSEFSVGFFPVDFCLVDISPRKFHGSNGWLVTGTMDFLMNFQKQSQLGIVPYSQLPFTPFFRGVGKNHQPAKECDNQIHIVGDSQETVVELPSNIFKYDFCLGPGAWVERLNVIKGKSTRSIYYCLSFVLEFNSTIEMLHVFVVVLLFPSDLLTLYFIYVHWLNLLNLCIWLVNPSFLCFIWYPNPPISLRRRVVATRGIWIPRSLTWAKLWKPKCDEQRFGLKIWWNGYCRCSKDL